jgi:hypothetical protein
MTADIRRRYADYDVARARRDAAEHDPFRGDTAIISWRKKSILPHCGREH